MISTSSSSKNLPTIIVCALIALNQLMMTTIEAQAPDLQQSPFVASSLINGDLGSNDLVAGISSIGGNGARQQASSSMPGHYEFEVAPKMEPPSVRKPPYQQSATQSCPESGE